MENESLATELLHTLKASIKILYIVIEILLSTIRKMLSELYMTCDLEEKEIFKKHLETLQNITQPNII